ncbi:MAG: hemolysin family protein [Planctomycetota bacterium]|jgi:CBS domain containing-hemolysin-like protein|nr:hemolysin family protein [Planctomycetota bacterium]
MDDPDGYFPVIILFLLALLGALSAACETALQYMRVSRLEETLAKRGRRRGRFLDRILDRLQHTRFSSTFISGALLTAFVVDFFCHFCHSRDDGNVLWVAGVAVLFIACLRGLAEIVGDVLAERLVIALAAPIWLMTVLFSWLTVPVFALYRLMARGAGYDLQKKPEDLTSEVIAAVSDGEIAGVVNNDQRKMIERVFHFEHANVADVLTPRTEVEMLDVSLSLADAIAQAQQYRFSRIPVYEESRDNIVGIFYIRDILNYWGKETPALRELLHKPLFVPETKNITEMLSLMRRSQTQMAIVLDEYGGTAGLVTIEDLLEEIVGNIRDEYDSAEKNYTVKTLATGHVVAEGHVHVSDVNDALDRAEIPENQDYDTIGGFVSYVLGYIPQTGETLTYENLKIKVLAADERKVKQVEIEQSKSGK